MTAEDKTEIVVKKMRTVITPTTMAQIKKIASQNQFEPTLCVLDQILNNKMTDTIKLIE